MDSFEKVEEDHLPPKDAFFSKLYNADISDADYVHVQAVWNTLNIRTLGEYHDLYLKSMHPFLNYTFRSELNSDD